MESHKETPSMAILYKWKCQFLPFTKLENWRMVEQVLSGEVWLVPVVGGGEGRQRIWEGEYSANTVYTCM
jgi:hypothetical protein